MAFSFFDVHDSNTVELTALEIADAKWSYKALNGIADILGCKLPDQNYIAILAHRKVEAYSGILSVFNSGRTYVPISPKDPPMRVAKKLATIGCTTIISSANNLEREQQIADCSSAELTFIDLVRGEEMERQQEFNEEHAYIMFTSGTTGEPKPVPVKRSSLDHYVNTVNGMFDLTSEDRFTQFFDLSFDLSVHDLFVCWSNGACLCVPESDDVFKWPAYVREAKPTVWFSVPSVVRAFERIRVLTENAFSSIRLSLFCGEALYWSDVKAWKNAVGESQLVNLYGPTECTIAVGMYALNEHELEGIVPIGEPFIDHDFSVKNASDGKGELIISGPQVFDGYIGRPDQPFVEQEGKKWYRTGDLVSKDENGIFHFHGRLDDQVKIRGHRVELGEIDEMLNKSLDGFRATTLRLKKGSDRQTISFIEGAYDAQTLFEYCRKELPEHMHPDGFHSVEHFPLNVNGKVDKNALMKIFEAE